MSELQQGDVTRCYLDLTREEVHTAQALGAVMGIPTSEVFKRALGELHKRYVRSPEFEQFVMEEAGKVQTGEAPASDATPAMGVEVQAAIEAAPNVVRFLSRDLRPE